MPPYTASYIIHNIAEDSECGPLRVTRFGIMFMARPPAGDRRCVYEGSGTPGASLFVVMALDGPILLRETLGAT